MLLFNWFVSVHRFRYPSLARCRIIACSGLREAGLLSGPGGYRIMILSEKLKDSPLIFSR